MQAEVAELADALRSGRSESNLMRVQVPPSAQNRDPLKSGFFVGQVASRWNRLGC